MRQMFRIMAIALVGVALSGCAPGSFGAKVEGVISAVTGATVSPAAIIIAANSYDALEATAKNYINPQINKRCNGSNGPICRDPTATVKLNAAIRSGRVARNNAKQFLRDHPGQLGNQGLYDALQTAVSTLQSIFAQYNIGATP